MQTVVNLEGLKMTAHMGPGLVAATTKSKQLRLTAPAAARLASALGWPNKVLTVRIESWPILGGDHFLSAERNPASSGTRDELLFIFAGLVPSLAVRSENACRLTTKAVLARTCSIDAGNVPSQSRVHYNRTAHGMDLFR
jgi:hypothetical protein